MAARTPVGDPVSESILDDRRGATPAGLTGSFVHPGFPSTGPVSCSDPWTRSNIDRHEPLSPFSELEQLLVAELVDRRMGIDALEEEQLRLVYVPHSGNHPLVQEDLRDRSPWPGPGSFDEVTGREGRIEQIRSETCQLSVD